MQGGTQYIVKYTWSYIQSAGEPGRAWPEMRRRGAAHRLALAKSGCMRLLHYADMVLHGAAQVGTQTMNEAIFNHTVWLWMIPEHHIAERAILAGLFYVLAYQNKHF